LYIPLPNNAEFAMNVQLVNDGDDEELYIPPPSIDVVALQAKEQLVREGEE
jgi:hypothetical protein